MADLIVHDLGKLSSIANGTPVQAKSGGNHSVTATVQGTGSVSFSGQVMGTNDIAGTWTKVATVTGSGTTTASGSATFSDDYRFWRFDVTAMTGTSVLAVLATDPLGTGAPSTSSGTVGSDVVFLIGQSNMVGNDTTFDTSFLDPIDPRIWRYVHAGCTVGALSSYLSQISIAKDPLGHPDSMAGMGIGLPFARWYAQSLAAGRRILLVPLAVQGTKLVTTTPPTWNSTVSGSLFDQAVSGANAAMVAAGPGSRAVATLYLQGESDAIANETGANYQAALVALIAAFRARVTGAAAVPFITFGMVPEFAQGTHSQIRAVHRAIGSLAGPAAYAGGASGYTGDRLHYTSPGQRLNGRYAAESLNALLGGLTLNVASAPTGLTIGQTGGISQALSWTAPTDAGGSSIVDYVVHYSSDGGTTWNNCSHVASAATSATVTGLTASTTYTYRVAAVTSVGIGDFSSTVSQATTVSTTVGLQSHGSAPTGTEQPGQYTLGTAITAARSGAVSGIWVYASSGMVGEAATVGLYASVNDLTPLATGTGTLVLGWQKINLASSVVIGANQTFVAAFRNGSKFFGQSGGATWPVTSGPLTAPSGINGRYGSGATSINNPGTIAAANAFPVDVEFVY